MSVRLATTQGCRGRPSPWARCGSPAAAAALPRAGRAALCLCRRVKKEAELPLRLSCAPPARRPAIMSSLSSTHSTEQGTHVLRKEARRAKKKAHKVDKQMKEAREAAAARAEERAIQRLGLPPSPRASPKRKSQLGAAELAEKLSGSASERETVYGVLSSFTADDREFAVGFVAPLATVGVQSAEVVSPEEYRRSALALAHLIALDTAAVGAEWLKDEKCLASYKADGNALDAALSKGSDEELTHDDAMTAAAAQCCFAAAVVGSDFEPLFAAAEVPAEDWMGGLVVHNPYRQVVAPGDARNIRLSTLLLELLHDDAVDAVKLPKGLAPGVWNLLSNLACTRPAVGRHQVETGMVSLAVAELRRAPSLCVHAQSAVCLWSSRPSLTDCLWFQRLERSERTPLPRGVLGIGCNPRARSADVSADVRAARDAPRHARFVHDHAVAVRPHAISAFACHFRFSVDSSLALAGSLPRSTPCTTPSLRWRRVAFSRQARPRWTYSGAL